MYSRSLVVLVVQEWRPVAWALFVQLKTNLPIIWMLSLLRCVVSNQEKFLSDPPSSASHRIQVCPLLSASVLDNLFILPRFTHGLLDALNAEIALGTVANVTEGAQWISFTYYFVRMQKNPMVYGEPQRNMRGE